MADVVGDTKVIQCVSAGAWHHDKDVFALRRRYRKGRKILFFDAFKHFRQLVYDKNLPFAERFVQKFRVVVYLVRADVKYDGLGRKLKIFYKFFLILAFFGQKSQKVNPREVIPESATADTTALAPGTISTLSPSFLHSDTSIAPGSLTHGIPASVMSATFLPSLSREIIFSEPSRSFCL